jgi:hypothetical protein
MTNRDLTRAEVKALTDGTTQAPQGPWWRIGPRLAAQLLRCMDERDAFESQLKGVLAREAETYVRLENKIDATWKVAYAATDRDMKAEAEIARLRAALTSIHELTVDSDNYVAAIARAALQPAPTVTAGWPLEEGDGSIIVGNVKGDSHD